MKIITISREFGSGGRELGKRLADLLQFDYYDRELITTIAKKQGLDPNYVEKALEHSIKYPYPLTFRRSFSMSAAAPQSMRTELLLEQKRVIEGIAKLGRNCVIVGRNADVFLRAEQPLNLFVCADTQSKIQRCVERTGPGESSSVKEIQRNLQRIDRNRAYSRELISGGKWGDRASYHLIVNTTQWTIKELTPAVADFAVRWFGRTL